MATPPLPPPRPPLEPTPAFLAVLDLPLRFRLTPLLSARVDALAAASRGNPESWAPLYDEAVGIVEAFVADLTAQQDALQARLTAAEDPNEQRQRMAGIPRRDAEKAVAEARAALGRALKEAADRLRRQGQHVREQCAAQAASSLAVAGKDTADGLHVSVDPAWWGQFAGYVARCCDDWSAHYADAHEASFAAAVAPLSSLPLASGAAVRAPGRTSPAPATAGSAEPPGGKEVEIPSTGAALGGYIRSHLMSVGIVSSVLMAGLALVPGGASGASIAVRGLLLVAMLPPLTVLGWRGARKQRERLRKKALTEQRDVAAKATSDAVDRAVEAHRVALERWTIRRGEEWGAAIERWTLEVVQPRLAELEAGAGDLARQTRAQLAVVQEELNTTKMTRNQVSQSTLVDLKRRQRQLREA